MSKAKRHRPKRQRRLRVRGVRRDPVDIRKLADALLELAAAKAEAEAEAEHARRRKDSA